MKPEHIHFCHANGFPAKSYSVMLNQLSEQYVVEYQDMYGHHEAYPVTDHWCYLVDEVIEQIENNHDQPVIAVGHSLGGGLIYMASRQRPELFKHLILLDPALIDSMTSRLVGLAKRFNFIDKITPAGRTEGRQEVFENHDHAIEYFSGKSLFKYADPRCLKDYVTYGTEESDQGIRLRYKPETEVEIYRTIPHTVKHKKSLQNVNCTFLYGEKSNVVRPGILKAMQKMGFETHAMAGGHLFPLEFPEHTAEKITQVINAL